MPDRKTGSADGKSNVGNERTNRPQPFRFQVARGIEHLLHSGTASRSLAPNEHTVTGLNFILENAFDSCILALENPRRFGTIERATVNARSLDDTAFLREIPIE
jgi:hypothetical protein